MSDQLYLSFRTRDFGPMTQIRHWQKLLHLFPVSKLHTGEHFVRIQPVSFAEPPLSERVFQIRLNWTN